MTVKELMQEKVITVAPDDMVDRVFYLINFEKIRHLPVIEKGKVIGIVSDRDLYKTLGPRGRRRSVASEEGETELYVIPRKVKHIMRRGVITCGPDDDAGKAASMMAKRRIGALPVIDGSKLRGIITATDILYAFARHCSGLAASAAPVAAAKPQTKAKRKTAKR